jgi:hypothetical protein
MKEKPCLFLFKDRIPAFRFDYRGAPFIKVGSGVDCSRWMMSAVHNENQ